MLDNSSGVKTRHQKFPQLQSEQLLKRFLTNVFDSAEYYFYFSISLVKKYVQHVTQTAIFSSPQAHICNFMLFTPSVFFSPLLPALLSISVFFQVRKSYFGKFWVRGVCLQACVPRFVHGSISMSLPYLLFTDKVSVEDRSPLSLCASLNCRLVFPIFLPKGQQEHISHICGRPSLHHFSLAVIYSSFNISFFVCLPIKNRITPQHMYATFHATF